MAELKISYEKGWENSCVHIDIPIIYREDYRIHMIRNNSFPHLLKVTGSGRDGTTRYTFQSDRGIQMEEKYRTRDISADEILSFTGQLLETADSLKQHMLDPDGLLLAPNLVFADESTYQFCYLPVAAVREIYKKTLRESFHEMTEYFLSKMDYRETEAILLVYRLHRETMQENYDIRKILSEYKKECEDYKKEKEVVDQSELSEGTIFFSDSEGEREGIYPENQDTSCLKEKKPVYGPVKKMINRIKTGRWGQWEDMITEIDGQDRYRHL